MNYQVSTNNLNWSDLAASGLVRNLVSGGIDTLSFTVESEDAFTANDPFAYGSILHVRRGSTRIFEGRVASNPRIGSGADERQDVILQGPWEALADCTYQQTWKSWSINAAQTQNIFKCRVVLFSDSTGGRITAAAQVTAALNWAISRGAPMQIGTIEAPSFLPFDEKENIKCSEVITTVLRMLPDLVTWFDYTTSPPTFHLRPRSAVSAVSVAMADCGPVECTARKDLQIPGIVIQYEKTHTTDDITRKTLELDTAGNINHLKTQHLSFDLEGRTLTYLRADIETANIPALANNKTFLKQRVPWLDSIADADLEIVNVSRSESSPLPRMLLSPLPDWVGKQAVEETITWVINFTVKVGGVEVERKEGVTVKAVILTTDALTRQYKRLASFDSGEETPQGLAGQLYTAWGFLYHQGRIVLEAEETPGTYRPGQVLNLTGGHASLAAMATPVQTVTENYDQGQTVITFGPPARLEADTLMAIFRGVRARRFSWSLREKTTDESGNNNVDQSAHTPDTSSSSGGGETRALYLRHTSGSNTYEIKLDPSLVTFDESPTSISIQPREILALVPNGTGYSVQKMQVLASENYGDTVNLIPDEIEAGDLLIGGTGSLLERLPIGEAEDILSTDGTSPVWEATGDCEDEESE